MELAGLQPADAQYCSRTKNATLFLYEKYNTIPARKTQYRSRTKECFLCAAVFFVFSSSHNSHAEICRSIVCLFCLMPSCGKTMLPVLLTASCEVCGDCIARCNKCGKNLRKPHFIRIFARDFVNCRQKDLAPPTVTNTKY